MDDRTERIRAALSRHGATLQDVKPLHGGACQENFRVELTVDATPLRLALRSDAPTSLPGSIKRKAEFAVINAAVSAGVKTPSVRWLETSLLRDGSDAYFLDWAQGEAIGRRIVRNPELEAARAKLPAELAHTLAKLHQVTPTSGHQLPFAPPPQGPARGALDHLRKMLDGLPGTYPAVEFAINWLAARLPKQEEVVLVHGDFRTGNFLVTPD